MAIKKSKRSAKGLQTKQRILEVAEEHFADKGFYGARIDDIAAATDINKRMIYEYHTNKQTLYQNVLIRVYTRMEEVERNIVKQGLAGVELIETIVSDYFDFLYKNPTFVNILMWENLDKAATLKELPAEIIDRKETIQYFIEQIRIGKQEGIFSSKVDEHHMVVSLITVCFSNFSNRYTLTKLFHQDISEEKYFEERKKHTTDLILSFMTQTDD